MSTYEVHLGSWRQGLSYRELAEQLVGHVQYLGFTHVELMPVAEHPFGGSWGYQVSSYFAPTSRFGNPDDFRYLVDTAAPGRHRRHRRLGARALPQGRLGAGPLRRHRALRAPRPAPRRAARTGARSCSTSAAPRCATSWWRTRSTGSRSSTSTGCASTRWPRCSTSTTRARRASGCRTSTAAGRTSRRCRSCRRSTPRRTSRVPGIVTIAEESTAWPGVTRPTHLGGLGFGFKWNMGWMHDSLGYMANEPIYRQYHHHQMTFSMMYAYSENFVLPISHDEVVHGKGSLLRKMPGDRWQQLANLRAYLAFMWAHPGKQLLFMGSEFGQESEWAESRSLDWWLTDNPDHRGVQTLVARPQPGLRREPGAVVTATPTRAASPGSTPTTRATTCSRSSARATTARCSPASPTSPAIPHEGYRIGLPHGRPLGRGAQHRRGGLHAAAASATSARSRPAARAGTASRPRPPCGSRRSARSGSATHPPPDRTRSDGRQPRLRDALPRPSTTRPAASRAGSRASCRRRAWRTRGARTPTPRRRPRPRHHVRPARAVQTVDLAFAGADVPIAPIPGCARSTSVT